MRERIETVVIGGGQAGLAVGHELMERGREFLILDASQRIGDAWRNRWDSLRLFTPARIDGLPGMRFPARGSSFVPKDAMADFLESYAERFELPVRSGTRVERLSRTEDGFLLETADGEIEASNVVVAMANYQVPKVPSFASELDPAIHQLHSHEYRNLEQLRTGAALVVGLGNSGAEIGLELARDRTTWIAGKESAQVPFRLESPAGRHVITRLVRFAGYRVLTLGTPVGRKLRPAILSGAAPLIRTKRKDLQRAGAQLVDRVSGVIDGKPALADGSTLDVANVIWCTGYRPGFDWIDIPVLDEHEEPEHERGVVPSVPGLYFVGLNFLYAIVSDTITGVGRDAAYVVDHLDRGRPRSQDGALRPRQAVLRDRG